VTNLKVGDKVKVNDKYDPILAFADFDGLRAKLIEAGAIPVPIVVGAEGVIQKLFNGNATWYYPDRSERLVESARVKFDTGKSYYLLQEWLDPISGELSEDIEGGS